MILKASVEPEFDLGEKRGAGDAYFSVRLRHFTLRRGDVGTSLEQRRRNLLRDSQGRDLKGAGGAL